MLLSLHNYVIGKDMMESAPNHQVDRSDSFKQARKANRQETIVPEKSLVSAVKAYGAADGVAHGVAHGAAYRGGQLIGWLAGLLRSACCTFSCQLAQRAKSVL